MNCDREIEAHKHLLFNCVFSKQCIQSTKIWLRIDANTTDVYVLPGWINKRIEILVLLWSVLQQFMVYTVWSRRYKALWEQKVAIADYVVKSIQG